MTCSPVPPRTARRSPLRGPTPLLRALRGADGSVVAEFAVVVPAVVAVVGAALIGVGAGVQAVRLADAAAVAARQTARGDAASVPGTLSALAPGAVIATTVDGELTCVHLTRAVSLGPLVGPVALTGRSCAPQAGG